MTSTSLSGWTDALLTRARDHSRPVQLFAHDMAATVGLGKGLRSALLDTVYLALGGTDDSVRGAAGTAVELLHEALVVHDDIIDGDDSRHGQPNLIGRTTRRAGRCEGLNSDPAHLGQTAGVLGGDLLIAAAYSTLARIPVSEEQRTMALDLLDGAVFSSVAGELDDVAVAARAQPPTPDESVRISALKTGVYSLEFPTLLGAVLAGATPDLLATLRRAARQLGTAYQIVDDLLGVFGSPELTGKSVDADLRERKGTVLLAHAAKTDAWPELDKLLGPQATDEHLERARVLLVECGAREEAQRRVDELADSARTTLTDASVSDRLRRDLEPVIEAALERTR